MDTPIGQIPLNGSGDFLGLSGWAADIENWIQRAGLIFVGIVIILVALWYLLGEQGIVPGPAKTAKAALAF